MASFFTLLIFWLLIVVAILIGQLDTFLDDLVRPYIASQHKDAGEWQLDFHRYGQHQVSTLPNQLGQPGEVLIIGEALASTQEIANSLAATARFATAVSRRPKLSHTATLTNVLARGVRQPESDLWQPRMGHRRKAGDRIGAMCRVLHLPFDGSPPGRGKAVLDS